MSDRKMTETELFEKWFNDKVISDEKADAIGHEKVQETIATLKIAQRQAWKGCAEFKNAVIASLQKELDLARTQIDLLRQEATEKINEGIRIQNQLRLALKKYADPKFQDKGTSAKKALANLSDDQE